MLIEDTFEEDEEGKAWDSACSAEGKLKGKGAESETGDWATLVLCPSGNMRELFVWVGERVWLGGMGGARASSRTT